MEKPILQSMEIQWEKIPEDSYLRSIPSLQNTEKIEFHAPITFFSGENGSGKSTVLEALAICCGLNPEGGSKNYHFATYDSHSPLCEALRIARGIRRERRAYFLRAESFYNVASAEEEYSRQGGVPSKEYHRQSHGESFLQLIRSFQGDGLYFLDEPEAALSPQRQLTLLGELHALIGDGAQFLIATHSPILLGMPESEILLFTQKGIHPVRWEETEAYQVTKLFLNRRELVLQELLGTKEEYQ